MKNFAAILSILFIVVTPRLAQGDDTGEAVDQAACVAETTSLTANQAVMDAYQAMVNEVEADLAANPLQFCNIISLACTIDVGEYTSSLKTTCEAEGGQLVEREVNATCSGNLAGVPLTDFEVATEGVPLCAGASCDPGALPAEIETGLETVVEDIVAGINLASNGTLVCDIEIGSGGGGGGSGEETAVPSGDGGETDTTPPPTPSGDGSAPTPTAPSSGAQAATIWVSAACLTLVSFIWM